MTGFPWWGWMIFAGVLALAELHVPGSYLVWIAVGAALTGAVDAAFGLSVEEQLGTFAASSALSCVVGYFVYRRMHRQRRGETLLNDRSLAMVGARGTVCEAFSNGRGKVRLGDGVWLADGPDLVLGAPVVVSAVRGTRLVVQGMQPRSGAGLADAIRAS
jgi:membrane protein implicated in regulation of membrane protease activity